MVQKKLFCRITGATRLVRGARADALLAGWRFEIKKASHETVSQVRPVRFLTIVVWERPRWYVIPAERTIAYAARRDRGQHTENQLDCVVLALNSFADCVVDDTGLGVRSVAVASASDTLTRLKLAMQESMHESKALASAQRRRAIEILEAEAPQARLFK